MVGRHPRRGGGYRRFRIGDGIARHGPNTLEDGNGGVRGLGDDHHIADAQEVQTWGDGLGEHNVTAWVQRRLH